MKQISGYVRRVTLADGSIEMIPSMEATLSMPETEEEVRLGMFRIEWMEGDNLSALVIFNPRSIFIEEVATITLDPGAVEKEEKDY